MKRFEKYLLLALLIITINACGDFLSVEPDEQVSIKEQFSTKLGIQQAVNGVYYQFEALISGKYHIYADLVGGDLSFPPTERDSIVEFPAGIDMDRIYEFADEAFESDFVSFYEDGYEIINAINVILSEIENTAILDGGEYKQVVAEMLACRAYTHFMLTLVYAQNYSFTTDASHPGIVYNLQALKAGVDYPSRKTMAETYRLMKADMDEALSNFTGTNFLSYGNENTYFNEITSTAVFARIALQMNDWESAYGYADFVIEHSGLQLTPDSLYLKEWEDSADVISETVFELADPETSEGQSSSSISSEFFLYDSSEYRDFIGSGDLLELYPEEDIRKDLFLEVLMPYYENDQVSFGVFSFTGKFQAGKGTPFVRLSEMYLIRAEAALRMSNPDPVSALSDLNAIRERVHLQPAASGDDLLEEIFLERRRELAFENHLLYDIARYHKDIVRDKGCVAPVKNLAYPSDYYVLPIPENSLQLNENMVQNEGY